MWLGLVLMVSVSGPCGWQVGSGALADMSRSQGLAPFPAQPSRYAVATNLSGERDGRDGTMSSPASRQAKYTVRIELGVSEP
jgi:hypothetical protein